MGHRPRASALGTSPKRVSRQRSRTVLLGVGIALAVAVLGVSAAAQAGNTVSGGQKISGTVVFAGLGGAVQPAFQQCALDPFQKQYPGVTVQYVPYQPNAALATLVAQRQAETLSVVWVSNATQFQGNYEKLFLPLTAKDVPNLKYVRTADQKERLGGIPFSRVVFGLEYNPVAFAKAGIPAPTSLTALFDPRLKGHVAVLDISVAVSQLTIAQLAVAMKAPIADPKAVFQRYANELKPNLFGVLATAAQSDQGFQQGNVWLTVNTGARVQQLQASGTSVDFVVPKEGGALVTDYLDVPKGAPNPAAGKAFINYVLGRTVQGCIASSIGHAPLATYGVTPPELSKFFPSKNLFYVPWPPVEVHLKTWIAEWNKALG